LPGEHGKGVVGRAIPREPFAPGERSRSVSASKVVVGQQPDDRRREFVVAVDK
jgi:hypothetical protein